MAEEKQQTEVKKDLSGAVEAAVAKSVYGAKKFGGKKPAGGRFEKKDDGDQRILDIARVTRVMKGGKRMSFRACVALGDRNGSIGIGLGKGADVTIAVNKAVNQAKKKMFKVVTVNDTLPHAIECKVGAAKILFKPAKKGRGVIAGGVVRVILELAGVKNATSKILGTNNKINNARCVMEALRRMKKVEPKKVKEVKEEVAKTEKAKPVKADKK
jgi:small subunit ribosomal protein S5